MKLTTYQPYTREHQSLQYESMYFGVERASHCPVVSLFLAFYLFCFFIFWFSGFYPWFVGLPETQIVNVTLLSDPLLLLQFRG